MDTERLKLLVVDDEDAVHRALNLTLRREPYDLVHAYDAAEAVYVLRTEPDIRGVLSDYNMPGVNGLDFLIHLRLHHPELPAVLISGEATVELAARGVNEAHVHGIVTKPWNGSALRELLRETFLPSTARPDVRQKAVEAIEETLQAELAPTRDPETGAFLIEPDGR